MKLAKHILKNFRLFQQAGSNTPSDSPPEIHHSTDVAGYLLNCDVEVVDIFGSVVGTFASVIFGNFPITYLITSGKTEELAV